MHSAAFKPSDEQSEIGQPWSCVENGHAPLEMWRYLSRWSVSSRTCEASTCMGGADDRRELGGEVGGAQRLRANVPAAAIVPLHLHPVLGARGSPARAAGRRPLAAQVGVELADEVDRLVDGADVDEARRGPRAE